MNNTRTETDLIIVGGGLAGCSLALALAGTGQRVTMVDTRPPQLAGTQPTPADPRAYAISPAAACFLDDIGIWRHLPPHTRAPVSAMDIRGDRGAQLRFTAYQAQCEALAWIIESTPLENELRETARRQAHVTLLAPASPTALAITAESASLTLDDGSTLRAPLIVGADGRDSWVREAAGLSAREHDYHEHGVVACFACAEAHGGTARQWFFGDSVLAWLPLPGQRISIVWSAPEALAQTLLAASPEALALRVAAAGDHALGVLKALTPARAFPLRMLKLANSVAPRVALLGDAAHALHPLSGHGINLGFLDARELAQRLRTRQSWEDPGDLRLLQRYQRARAEEIRLMQEATHGLHALFLSRLPGLGQLRNFGLSLAERLPHVKSWLARYAMG